MKILKILSVAVLALGGVETLALKTDAEVYQITAAEVQRAIVASSATGQACGIDFDEANFTASLVGNSTGLLSESAGLPSVEGQDNNQSFLEGAIIVAAGEAYLTKEEFHAEIRREGAEKMVLGLKVTISRNSCKSEALSGELVIFNGKDNNVVSKTQFEIK